MLSPELKRALLVGSSGELGPIWKECLLNLGLEVFTADFADVTADFQLDLADSNSIREVTAGLPHFDVVILNAGVDAKLESPGSLSTFEAFAREKWNHFFSVNVIGQAELLESLIPKLNANALVIGIGSMYGLVSPRLDVYNPEGGTIKHVKHPGYGASKAAFANLFRQYAVQHAGRVSFNLLTLGVVAGDQPEHFRNTMPTHIPTGTFLTKRGLGKHLKALIESSDLNFTGQNIVVDGGYTLW